MDDIDVSITNNPVDAPLLVTAKTELTAVAIKISRALQGSPVEPASVANLFLAPLVPALATAMNATQRPGDDTITSRRP